MNLLAQRLLSLLSVAALLGLLRPQALFLDPDTDLERYLFYRDLRSSGPPRR